MFYVTWLWNQQIILETGQQSNCFGLKKRIKHVYQGWGRKREWEVRCWSRDLVSQCFWRLCPFMMKSLLITWSPWISSELQLPKVILVRSCFAALSQCRLFFTYRCCFSGLSRWGLNGNIWLIPPYNLTARCLETVPACERKCSLVGTQKLVSFWNAVKGEYTLGFLVWFWEFCFLTNCPLIGQCRVLVLIYVHKGNEEI